MTTSMCSVYNIPRRSGSMLRKMCQTQSLKKQHTHSHTRTTDHNHVDSILQGIRNNEFLLWLGLVRVASARANWCTNLQVYTASTIETSPIHPDHKTATVDMYSIPCQASARRGMASEANIFYKRFASLPAEKWNNPYNYVLVALSPSPFYALPSDP